MATAVKTDNRDDVIDPTKVYPLATFKRIVGYGDWAMRQARRDGLRVIYRGNRAFVRGADFDAFLQQSH